MRMVLFYASLMTISAISLQIGANLHIELINLCAVQYKIAQVDHHRPVIQLTKPKNLRGCFEKRESNWLTMPFARIFTKFLYIETN